MKNFSNFKLNKISDWKDYINATISIDNIVYDVSMTKHSNNWWFYSAMKIGGKKASNFKEEKQFEIVDYVLNEALKIDPDLNKDQHVNSDDQEIMDLLDNIDDVKLKVINPLITNIKYMRDHIEERFNSIMNKDSDEEIKIRHLKRLRNKALGFLEALEGVSVLPNIKSEIYEYTDLIYNTINKLKGY